MDAAQFQMSEAKESPGDRVSPIFEITADMLIIPVTGNPLAEGNRLALEILGNADVRAALIVCKAANAPGAQFEWRVPVGEWWRMRGRVVVRENRDAESGWIKVGVPRIGRAEEP